MFLPLPHTVPVFGRGERALASDSPGVQATGHVFSPHAHWSPPQFLDEPLPTVHHWTSQQVGQWLHSLNLEQYAAEFAARQVDGPQLLQLDGSKLKVGQSGRALSQPEPEATFKDWDPLILTSSPSPALTSRQGPWPNLCILAWVPCLT